MKTKTRTIITSCLFSILAFSPVMAQDISALTKEERIEAVQWGYTGCRTSRNEPKDELWATWMALQNLTPEYIKADIKKKEAYRQIVYNVLILCLAEEYNVLIDFIKDYTQ